MKHKKISAYGRLRILVAGLLVLSLGACLKDTGPVQDFSKSNALVGFQYKGVSAIPMTASILAEANDSFGVEVTLSVPSLTLKKDVQVVISPSDAALTNYNNANGTTYQMIEASQYTYPTGGTLTIPAGQQIVPFVVRFDGTAIDFNSDPALALVISSANGATIATNLDTIIIPIKLKNPYEGNYQVTGYFVHPSAPRAINAVKSLSTVSVIRSEGQVGDLGGNTFQFDVDPVTNKVSNWAPTGSTNPASGFINGVDNATNDPNYPGGDYNHTIYNNTYDPATHTFYLHYGYNGSNPGYSREIYEKWVLQP